VLHTLHDTLQHKEVITDAEDPPLCWWCGAPADSREHKFKASELRLNNGAAGWSGSSAVVHSQDDELREIQGPNSDRVKFSPSMCQNCNNARSQPFDLAYDNFIQYMSKYESTVAVDRRFRFSDIYGAAWPTERVNLIKYWVKHICCRSIESSLLIPAALIDYMDSADGGAPPHLRLDLIVQADLLRLRLHDNMPYGSFFGDAMGYTRDGELVGIESHVMWGWLSVPYTLDATEPFGSTTFEGDLVQMGWFSQVSTEYTLDPSDLFASEMMSEWRANTGWKSPDAPAV
jgi:hypothetical protein